MSLVVEGRLAESRRHDRSGLDAGLLRNERTGLILAGSGLEVELLLAGSGLEVGILLAGSGLEVELLLAGSGLDVELFLVGSGRALRLR